MNDTHQLHPALQEAPQEALRALLDLVGAVLFIVDVAPDGSLRFGGLNSTYEKVTGLRNADFQGRTPEECLPPATAQWVSARYRDCIAAGESIEYQERLDLGRRPTWWRTTLMPMREAGGGRIFRLIGTTVDITAERAAQEEVKRLAHLYKESFDRTPVMQLTMDAERRLVRASDYLLRRLGYAREEMLGRLPADFMTPDSAEMGRQVVVPRLLETGEARDVPYTLLTAAGEPLEALVSAVAIRDRQGALLEYNVVALEVTPLTEANRRLSDMVTRLDESERMNREVYARTPAMLYSLDPLFRIIRVSDYWLEAMGYRREEVLGRQPIDFMTPDSARYAREEVVPALQREGRLRDIPYAFIRADGSVMEVLLSTNTVHAEDGRPLRSNSVMTDVTERNRAFRELDEANRQIAERERRERELYDRTPAMLYSLGPDFRIRAVSDHWLQVMGYRRDEVLGRLPFDFMTPASMVRAREAMIPAMLAHGRIDDIPWELYRGDGSIIEVLVSSTSERDADGHFTRIYSVMRDVTERNRAWRELEAAAAQLAEKNRELEHFAHIASHDLREPLRKVRAFADRLRGRFGERLGEDGRQYLDKIESSVDRMRDLIQDLLALSLASSKEMRFTPVDLGLAVRQAVADLDHVVQRQGADIAIAGSFPTVAADPVQIGQLFANLVGNALKYRLPDRQPSIVIEGAATPDRVQIRIRDNGIGFDPDQAGNILKPFVRLHGRSAYEGTGMGLAICQKIVSRHNGSLTAEGRPGEGATFTVELPRWQAGPPAG